MMSVFDFGLIDEYNAYLNERYPDLFPPQLELFGKGFLTEDKNWVVAMNTGSGKTLVGLIAMLRGVLLMGKSIYIAPLRALAYEKYKEFKQLEELGLKVAISTGESIMRSGEELGGFDILVMTPEKLELMIRGDVSWLSNVNCLVVDEVHEISSRDRGFTIESVITKLRVINKDIRVIGLSATIGGISGLSGWLGAEVFISDWRPVELKKFIYHGGKLVCDGQKPVGIRILNKIPVLNVVTMDDNCKIVFCHSRKRTEDLAVELSRELPKIEEVTTEGVYEYINENDNHLANVMNHGVAFHHAGLNTAERRMVENAFLNGDLSCIFATPTLAAGVNLPAHTVILERTSRWNGEKWVDLSVEEVNQMMGRAGRPGFDIEGEAILICDRYSSAEYLYNKYLAEKLSNVTSALFHTDDIANVVLAIVCSGAQNKREIGEFFGNSFYGYLVKNGIILSGKTEQAIGKLIVGKMIVAKNGKLFATDFGSKINKYGLSIDTGILIHRIFTDSEGMAFPDWIKLVVKCQETVINNIDEGIAYKIVNMWVNGKRHRQISIDLDISEGDIVVFIEKAKWVTFVIEELARITGRKDVGIIRGLMARVTFGVDGKLVDLVKLDGIGEAKAKALYSVGIKNRRMVKSMMATPDGRRKISKLVGEAAFAKITKQLRKR